MISTKTPDFIHKKSRFFTFAQTLLWKSVIKVPLRSEGPVIALELSGDGVVEACRSIADEVFSGTKVRLVRFLRSYLIVSAEARLK